LDKWFPFLPTSLYGKNFNLKNMILRAVQGFLHEENGPNSPDFEGKKSQVSTGSG
jgi:hypothetical protein